MSLQFILGYIQEAKLEVEQAIANEKKYTGEPVMYTFIYEQQHGEKWLPNYQHIQACSLEQAFHSFGLVIETMHITVRNICYGRYSEMESEQERIREFWFYRKRHEERKEHAE